jgi:hypothetical protein
MAATRSAQPRVKLSRWQVDLFCKCARCFWLLKRHGVKQPDSYPLALNTCMDHLLKAEFDQYRAAGRRHPILIENRVEAKLFPDLARLQEWRNTFQGLRWTDPATGHTLFGAVDDILEYPDGSLAVVDYKSSGAAEAHIYDSYQLQMDVYTFLLQRMGYRTAPTAFFAFFIAVRDQGFQGRLPFRAVLLEVTPQPQRVAPLFVKAAATALQDQLPPPGEGCDLCRWSRETVPLVAAPPPAAAPASAAPARTSSRSPAGQQQDRFEFAG